MDAASFEQLFVPRVAAPAAAVGFERWGKGLWFERGDVQAAVLRTETRNDWPFRLTLVVRHTCVRDFDGRLPAPRTRNPNEWPVKLAPSSAADLLSKRWRYRPCNGATPPGDVFDDPTAAAHLAEIGRALEAAFPVVCDVLTPARMRRQLAKHHEDAWCERRWMADYDAFVAP